MPHEIDMANDMASDVDNDDVGNDMSTDMDMDNDTAADVPADWSLHSRPIYYQVHLEVRGPILDVDH